MIDLQKTILDLTTEQPEILEFLINNGFEQLSNPLILKSMGASMTLDRALKLRKINAELFTQKLDQYLAQMAENPDFTKKGAKDGRGDVDIKGVLPCPIHMPLRDAITAFTEKLQAEEEISITMDLRSANLGISWIADEPDIITSAGFEFFFSKEMKEKYLEPGIYSGGGYPVDPDFARRGADLADPNGHYHIMGVVPAIFIVNKKALNGREMPRAWKDLLKPEYAASVAIPHGDLDLYNAITLTIMSHYGEEGIRALGRATAEDLHPSQMTASKAARPLPLVNVAPYFFSLMVNDPNLEVVWPEDGAIVSPIFMIARTGNEKVKKITDYLCSAEVAELFSHSGKFPATRPGTDNHLTEDQKMLFPGWDFLNSVDVEEVLERSDRIFRENSAQM